MKRTFYIICLLMLSDFSFGQNKRYVEEIALYHLDSLTKIDPEFKNFKYFTNGYLSKWKSDTVYFKKIKSDLYIKTSFKDVQIIEDTSLANFSIPNKLRRNGSSSLLIIDHFYKHNDKYYVFFNIETNNYSGQEAYIIMNLKGDLIGRKYSYWIE